MSSNELPSLPESFQHVIVKLNNKTYHYVEQGPCDAPLVILLHGFPESWYNWVYLLDFMNQQQFRLIALDMPGYGETNIGEDLTSFSYKSICNDIFNLIQQQFQGKSCHFIGHEWGAQICYLMGFYYPTIVNKIIGVTLPLLPPQKDYYSASVKSHMFPVLGYMAALENADNLELDENLSEFVEFFYSHHPKDYAEKLLCIPLGTSIIDHQRQLNLPKIDFPPPPIKDYLLNQLKANGTTGPTNWYRTSELDHEDELSILDQQIHHPVLMLIGRHTYLSHLIDRARPFFSNLQVQIIEEAGHWCLLTHHKQLNPQILKWLKTV